MWICEYYCSEVDAISWVEDLREIADDDVDVVRGRGESKCLTS